MSSERLQRDLRGAAWLTLGLLARLVREPQIRRSLVFPPALGIGTMLITMVIVGLNTSPQIIEVPSQFPAISSALAEGGFRVVTGDGQPPRARGHFASTDGHTLWVRDANVDALRVEGILRKVLGARWRPAVSAPPLRNSQPGATDAVSLLIVAPYVLYGVVFGAGMVARDRDDGTMEADLALPLHLWVHGAARVLSSGLALSLAVFLGLLFLDATLGITGLAGHIRHGIAASFGAAAIGVASAGRGGIKAGFGATLSVALTLVTAMGSLGVAMPSVGRYVAISSLGAGGDGWGPLLCAGVFGVVASLVFAWRQSE